MFQAGNKHAPSNDEPAGDGRYLLGALNNSNFLMKDHASGSWWSQLDGACRHGPRVGDRLPAVPTFVTTWRRRRELFADTRVIAPDGEDTGYDYELPVGGKGYAEYLENDKLMGVPPFDERGLRRKAWCIGLSHGDEAVAWPYAELDQLDGPLNDEVGGKPAVVLWEPAHRTAWVYWRQLDGQTLEFGPPDADAPDDVALVDLATGSTFDAAGRGLEGTWAGRELAPAGALEVLWFAWAVFHRNTRLFAIPKPAEDARDAA